MVLPLTEHWFVRTSIRPNTDLRKMVWRMHSSSFGTCSKIRWKPWIHWVQQWQVTQPFVQTFRRNLLSSMMAVILKRTVENTSCVSGNIHPVL